MNDTLKAFAKSPRILLLVFLLILAVVAIGPKLGTTGVAIVHVETNSAAHLAGIEAPEQGIQPTDRETITSILGIRIADVDDYREAIEQVLLLDVGAEVPITTTKGTYVLSLQPQVVVEVTDELEEVLVNRTYEVFNETLDAYENVTITETVEQNRTIEHVVGVQDIGLDVKNAPTTNIRMGLDLEGGVRVVLQPETELSSEDFELLLDSMKQRLNVYGLSDIRVVQTRDLAGQRFILVEVPGASQQDVEELVTQQGHFEARIAGSMVFSGGNDIRSVLRGADRAGIDYQSGGCQQRASDEWNCRFFFGIVLSPEAARRQAMVTQQLDVITVDEFGQPLPRESQFLSEQLDFYLDGMLIESLNIASDLRGRAVTEIQISGSEIGRTRDEAIQNAQTEMRRLQTVLITGSLPVSLEIVKTDNISPMLGQEFLKNALFIGLLIVFAVVAIVVVRYRRFVVAGPMVVTLFAEIILLLGVAAAIRWSLDMAAIAGILIVLGTGVDHLIIITDETLKKASVSLSILQKIKRAFSIVLVAGLTTMSAMVPLLFAGAGLLRGFALTTIIGVTLGILVARPAYSAMLEILLRDEEQ